MKQFFTVVFFLLPLFALAHATPVRYVPEAVSVVATHPTEAVIYFSEPVVPASASITVFAPDGTKNTSHGDVSEGQPKALRVKMQDGGEGVYTLSWQVVSLLDGHFTKGAFSFFVGKAESAPELYSDISTSDVQAPSSVWNPLIALFRPTPKPLWSLERVDSSRTIVAQDMGTRTGALRLFARNSKGEIIGEGIPPIIVLNNSKEGIGPLIVPAKTRRGGLYDIPWALFAPNGVWQVAVTWRVSGEYDINTTFQVEYPHDVVLLRDQYFPPRVSITTLSILLLVVTSIVLGVWYTRVHGNK